MLTSAFKGLMHSVDSNVPGDGEIDLTTFGTILYTILIITLGYKVLYERRSIIHGDGKFYIKSVPPEKWYDRYPWTWIGIIFLSYGFWTVCVYCFGIIGRSNDNFASYSRFNDTSIHAYNRSSIAWIIYFLAPITACLSDVTLKLFAHIYFPSQTQIHTEIEKKENINEANQLEQDQEI